MTRPGAILSYTSVPTFGFICAPVFLLDDIRCQYPDTLPLPNMVQIVSSDTSFSTDGITVALRKSHTNRKKDLCIYSAIRATLNVLAPVPNLTYPRSVCLLLHFSPPYIVKLASFFWYTRCHLSRALVRFSRVCSL